VFIEMIGKYESELIERSFELYFGDVEETKED
jgi:hypothetical protein